MGLSPFSSLFCWLNQHEISTGVRVTLEESQLSGGGRGRGAESGEVDCTPCSVPLGPDFCGPVGGLEPWNFTIWLYPLVDITIVNGFMDVIMGKWWSYILPSGYDIHSLPWRITMLLKTVNHLFRLGPFPMAMFNNQRVFFHSIGNSNPNWRTHIFLRGWNHDQPANIGDYIIPIGKS